MARARCEAWAFREENWDASWVGSRGEVEVATVMEVAIGWEGGGGFGVEEGGGSEGMVPKMTWMGRGES